MYTVCDRPQVMREPSLPCLPEEDISMFVFFSQSYTTIPVSLVRDISSIVLMMFF